MLILQEQLTSIYVLQLFLKAGSHDPILGPNYYLNSKKLVTPIDICKSWNDARKVIGSKQWILWTDLKK